MRTRPGSVSIQLRFERSSQFSTKIVLNGPSLSVKRKGARPNLREAAFMGAGTGIIGKDIASDVKLDDLYRMKSI